MDDDDPLLPASARRWQPAVGVGVGLAWLAVTAALLVVGAQADWVKADGNPRDLALLAASIILQVAAPVAVVILAAVLLRRTRRDEAGIIAALEARQDRAAQAADALQANVDGIDRALAGIGDRLAGLQRQAHADGDGLTAAAARLESAAAALTEAARAADTETARLNSIIPHARAQADDVAALLAQTASETTRQVAAIDTLLAAVWAKTREAQAQANQSTTALRSLFSDIEALAASAALAVGARAGELGQAVDAAFERTTQAMDSARDGVHVQTNALLASVDQARVALDHIGGEAARAIGKRLDRLNEAADLLGQRLSEQDARSRMLVETIERTFGVLDAKLNNAAHSGQLVLDELAQRTTGVREQLQTLVAPLGGTHDSALAMEATVGRLREGSEWLLDAFGSALPDHAHNLARLSDDVGRLHDETLRLSEPVVRGQAAIDAAGAAFAAQRAAMEAAAAQLTARLDAAHRLVGAIETQADGTALAASNQLIEVLSRVREIAGTTAIQMRETLSAVIAEAEAALAHAGSVTAEAAFVAPIRDQLAELESASHRADATAQAVTERVAQRLLGLTQTVATVETRIDEVDTRYDIRLRDDLLARSDRLIDSLNAGSVDIAKLLMMDVGDTTWDAYRRGDRSIFTRRIVGLIDTGTTRAIRRHYAHDGEFRDQASRYIDDFETLMKHVLADRDGKALAVTMLSSPIGKLYAVLAAAVERKH